MPKQRLIRLRIVVGALDENRRERARGDFLRGVGPYARGARGEGDGIRLDVAEDEDFVAGRLVADEEGGAVVHADGFLLDVAETASSEAHSRWGSVGVRGAPYGGVDAICGRRGNAAAAMGMAFHAVAVGDTPGFDGEAITELDVASSVSVAERDIPTFDEAHVGDEADAAFFIGEVGPDDIVEDVGFDGVDGGGEGGDFLGAGGVLE